MKKYYDVHNHLFNKNFLAKELLYRLMKELKKFISADEEQDRGIFSSSEKIKNVIAALKRYRYAIQVFSKQNSTKIYEEMNKTYKGEFILTPLTFDLTYCFASSADRQPLDLRELLSAEIVDIFGKVERGSELFHPVRGKELTHEEDVLREEYRREKELFLREIREFQKKDEEETQNRDRTYFALPGPFDGFIEQIKQLEELKNNPDYKDSVFPFLAVDPRRPGILEFARKNVGKGKTFIGIKLYCPNGYSPTDPVLYGENGTRDGVYAFCEDNGIPVTAHNSDGGFATLSKSVIINGLIHVEGALIPLNKEKLVFAHSIIEKNAISERALTLNHPLIWRKVVEKYPGLILNLAHFGGGEQLSAALNKPDDETLWSNRIIALLKDQRYNVYTDLSCYSNLEVVKKFYESNVFRDVKTRILYGSDYILLLLFENNFDQNVKVFREVFGNDFEQMAAINPKEFLQNVL